MAATAGFVAWGLFEERRRAALTPEQRLEEDRRLLAKGKFK